MAGRPVTVVADPSSADALGPLLEHWRSGPGLRLLPWGTVAAGGSRAVAALADDASAVLVVGPRERSPRTVLPAPVLTARDGRVVAAAWLPATTPADLARFARTAVAVHAERLGGSPARMPAARYPPSGAVAPRLPHPAPSPCSASGIRASTGSSTASFASVLRAADGWCRCAGPRPTS